MSNELSLNRIDCINVKNACDSCFQIEDLSKETTVLLGPDFPGPLNLGDIVPCSLNGSITCTVINKILVPDQPVFFTFVLLITVPLRLTNPNNPTKFYDFDFTFTKTATLCCLEGAALDCDESSLLSCICIAV